MEVPAQMRAVALAWPNGIRPRCKMCRQWLHRARQIDGTVIHYCGSGCRNELGLSFSAEQPQSHLRAHPPKTAEKAAA